MTDDKDNLVQIELKPRATLAPSTRTAYHRTH